MRLAVCLLTADRSAYTCETLESYVECADRPEFIRLHADDGSKYQSNDRAADAAGFETVYRTKERRGILPACRALWERAEECGATHILHLENDWRFERGLVLRDDCHTQRLYGIRKAKEGPRSLTGTHIMGTKEKIDWRIDGHAFERARAHWAGPPSITRIGFLLDAVKQAKRFKDMSMILNRLDTLRPRENVVWHIGEDKTPGGIYA